MNGSECITRDIRVTVRSAFSDERSKPDQQQWFFLYTVTIANEGEETVQLLERYWTITNSDGQAQTVRGPGVVGKQPVLKPGQVFEYTSGCPLDTELGCMHGYYTLSNANGERFQVEIAPFRLACDALIH